MPLYRLLRSNKESGPYSLNDLLALGLKPYDLVWIDGKSAAWRYPSEIAELKEFSPAVEEQPYDRFFKKPVPINQPEQEMAGAPGKTISQPSFREELNRNEPVKKEQAEIVQSIPAVSHGSISSLLPAAKQKVFVSMPETNGPDLYSHSYENKYEEYLPKAAKQKSLMAEEKASPINIHESDETRLETKYTQSLDDIKEMYINTLVQRKSRNKKREIIRKYLRPALLPALLLIAGVAIGYFFTMRKTSVKPSTAVSTVTPQQKNPEQKNETSPAENNLQPGNEDLGLNTNKKPQAPGNTNPGPETDNDKKALNPSPDAVLSPSKKQNKPSAIKNTISDQTSISSNFKNKDREKIVADEKSEPVEQKDIEVNPVTGERNSVVRKDNELPTRETNTDNETNTNHPANAGKKTGTTPRFIEAEQKNIYELVSVKTNNYVRGAFGGIRGLELTVYNNSNYLLDEVSVELQIMKPSAEPLRTDVITFKNIGANAAVTVKVPDSQRGIGIGYRITNIASKQWEKNTAGL